MAAGNGQEGQEGHEEGGLKTGKILVKPIKSFIGTRQRWPLRSGGDDVRVWREHGGEEEEKEETAEVKVNKLKKAVKKAQKEVDKNNQKQEKVAFELKKLQKDLEKAEKEAGEEELDLDLSDDDMFA